MSSQEEASNNISMPDLIVNECLFGCEGCPAIWENGQTGHRIICKCSCGHVRHKNNAEKVMLESARLGWETEGHQSKLGILKRHWCAEETSAELQVSQSRPQRLADGGNRQL